MNYIEQIKKYMEANGLTQWQMCMQLGCQPATLCRWLGGGHISYAWTQRIETFLKEKVAQ